MSNLGDLEVDEPIPDDAFSFDLVPTGMIVPWAGKSAPAETDADGKLVWLPCDGTTRNRTTFQELWDALRSGSATSPWGNGNGSTTFHLPDLQSVFPRGTGTDDVADTGGASTVTLTNSYRGIAAHDHTASGTTSEIGTHYHESLGSTNSVSHNHQLGKLRSNLYLGYLGGSGATIVTNMNAAPWTGNTQSEASHTHSFSVNSLASGSHSHTLSNFSIVDANAQSSTPHNNIPEYVSCDFIIKT